MDSFTTFVLISQTAMLSASTLGESVKPTQREIAEVGWHDEFVVDGGWYAEPWQCTHADEKAAAVFGSHRAFSVNSPGTMMAWTRTVEPIWVQPFGWLEVEYSCSGGAAEGYPQLLLTDDSTGPVTPNALNPENPLAGDHDALISLPAVPQGHEIIDLSKRYPSDRICRISIRIAASGTEAAKVAFKRIAFRSCDPRGPASQPAVQPAVNPLAEGSWKLIELPTTPFCTGIMEMGNLEVAGRWQGGELGLLMDVRAYGIAGPWYAAAGKRPSRPVTSPHQLAVRLSYDDGAVVVQTPRRMNDTDDLYVVPLDTGKTLVRFAVVERMSYGQVLLHAAGVRDALPQRAPKVAEVKRRDSVEQSYDGLLRIDAGRLSMVVDVRDGFVVRQMKLVGREIIAGGTQSLIDVRDADGKVLPLKRALEPVLESGQAKRLTARWTAGDAQTVTMQLNWEDPNAITVQASLENRSTTEWRGTMRVPSFASVEIAAQPSDASYLVGTRSALLGSENVKLDKCYGGPWPIPLVDLFDRKAGGGLGMYVADRQLGTKWLEIRHADGKSSVAVRYDQLCVPAGGTLQLPPSVLVPHEGDWHAAFDAYRAWARQGYTPQTRLANSFYCRRDYPLGGTTYLFDPAQRAYTADRLIDEGERCFGGVEFVDVSGWAYHEATGRVGDYLTNDLGGLEGVRKLADDVHARGGKLGLYFEGYLIDKRCALAAKALPDWQLIMPNGQPRWWSGDVELFVCPGIEAWRKELANAIATVAARTDADAVYVDEFGQSEPGHACWSPNHGHPVPSNPLAEERAMLQEIRAQLEVKSPKTALYIEFVPADMLTDTVDGAFDISLWDALPGTHPTKLLLPRYVFPELASYEMIGHGIRPAPFEVDDLYRALFHGLGLWLKGRGESWFTADCRELARRAHPIYAEHGDAFRSPDCEPLIPTLQERLYANRFSTKDKTIVTMYNAGDATVSGDLIELMLPAEREARELLSGRPAVVTRSEDGHAVLQGSIDPKCTAVFLLK